ncbi:hypothetical protein HYT33_04480 [Candidatus Roizmanbacteria bacterium]|nr:hypothetical protein [Candidatus Roizmanbacteria bacterium]
MKNADSPKEPNLKDKGISIVTMVVFVLLVFGGFYYLNSQSKSSKSKLSPTPSPKTTPAQTEEPTDTKASTQEQPTPTTPLVPSKTPTPTPVVFSVTGASASVDPSNFNGECPKKFNFTGTITVNAAGSVTYHWARSDGSSNPDRVLNFDEAGTQKVEPSSWNVGSSNNRWKQIVITAPNSTSSNKATFTLTCVH